MDLHRSPELSWQEEKTSAKMAARLRALGFEVTEKVGGFGVVGEARLQLTVRAYQDDVRKKLLAGIGRIARAEAAAAGAPREPAVRFSESTPATVNDPALTQRLMRALAGRRRWRTSPKAGAHGARKGATSPRGMGYGLGPPTAVSRESRRWYGRG